MKELGFQGPRAARRKDLTFGMRLCTGGRNSTGTGPGAAEAPAGVRYHPVWSVGAAPAKLYGIRFDGRFRSGAVFVAY